MTTLYLKREELQRALDSTKHEVLHLSLMDGTIEAESTIDSAIADISNTIETVSQRLSQAYDRKDAEDLGMWIRELRMLSSNLCRLAEAAQEKGGKR